MSIASEWESKFVAPGVSMEVAQVMLQDMTKEAISVLKAISGNTSLTFSDGSTIRSVDLWARKSTKNSL